jgi:hypothetical protein
LKYRKHFLLGTISCKANVKIKEQDGEADSRESGGITTKQGGNYELLKAESACSKCKPRFLRSRMSRRKNGGSGRRLQLVQKMRENKISSFAE